MFATQFALLLLAHLLSDFLFKTSKMAENKKNLKTKAGWSAMLIHAGVAFVFSAAALYLLRGGWLPLVVAAGVAAAHLGVDVLKNLVNPDKRCTVKFTLDQAVHAAIVAAGARIVSGPADGMHAGWYSHIQAALRWPAWSADKAVWTAIIGLAVVCGGAHFIRFLLNDLGIRPGDEPDKAESAKRGKGAANEKEEDGTRSAHAGKLIGILERIAILLLIAFGQWAAVGLLLTAKSVARHKLLDNKEYAEYYLIGTLLSFLIAVAGGLCIRGILSATRAMGMISHLQVIVSRGLGLVEHLADEDVRRAVRHLPADGSALAVAEDRRAHGRQHGYPAARFVGVLRIHERQLGFAVPEP